MNSQSQVITMNQKGQENIALAGVLAMVAVVVGVVVVSGVTAPMTETTFYDNASISTSARNGTAYTLTDCLSTTTGLAVYDWTNNTAVSGSDYSLSLSSQTFTLAANASGIAHNATIMTINYTGFDCGQYMRDSTTRTVVDNLPIIMGVCALGFAGMWLFVRGGL